MSFVVLPAIDLRQGKVVRLYQGDYTRQTDYAFDPVALAERYAADGANWLHVVDLDGARSGSFDNLAVLHKLSRVGLRVQAGGGVRQRDDVTRLLDTGVERVVLGSIAIRNPAQVTEWLQQFGSERLTLALDTRRRQGAWCLPSAGWTKNEAQTLDELAPRYAAVGARHLLCTDIDRDGTMTGPNLDLLAHVRRLAPEFAVQVSGGVQSLDDVRAARVAGAAGIVLGRALLEGKFRLEEALTC